MNSNTANGGRLDDDFCRFTYAPTMDPANAPDPHKLIGEAKGKLGRSERSTLSGGWAHARTVSRRSRQDSPGKVISQASSIRGWLQLPACRRLSFPFVHLKLGLVSKTLRSAHRKAAPGLKFQHNTITAFTGGSHMCSICVLSCSTNPSPRTTV